MAEKGKRQAEEWDRLPSEGPRAWIAFEAYRQLGPGRSLVKTAEAVGRSLGLVTKYSARHRWVDRALAWDAHETRLREEADRKAEFEERARVRKQRRVALTNLLVLAGKRLTPAFLEAASESLIVRALEVAAAQLRAEYGDEQIAEDTRAQDVLTGWLERTNTIQVEEIRRTKLELLERTRAQAALPSGDTAPEATATNDDDTKGTKGENDDGQA